MFCKIITAVSDKSESDLKSGIMHNKRIDRVIVGGENENNVPVSNNRISNELLMKFEGKSREVCFNTHSTHKILNFFFIPGFNFNDLRLTTGFRAQ